MVCENCGSSMSIDTEGDCNSYFNSEDDQYMEATCFKCHAIHKVVLRVESVTLIGFYKKHHKDRDYV